MANQQEALRHAQSCLQEYIQVLKKRLEEVPTYAEEQLVAIEFVQRFPEPAAPDDSYNSVEQRAQFTLDTGTFGGVILTKDPVRKLKDLVEPLRFLRERLGPYVVEDDPEMKRRIYKFRGQRFVFQAWFWNDADQDACRYVQVGTKEVPVMKLMCGEQEVVTE